MTDVLQRAREALPFMKETDDPYYETICELVAECERLQQVNQALDEQLVMKIKKEDVLPLLHERDNEIASLRSELTRWQKIAIEERAGKLILIKDCTQNEDAADFHHRCECGYSLEKCPIADWWREQAARELGAPDEQVGTGVFLIEANQTFTDDDAARILKITETYLMDCDCAECRADVAVMMKFHDAVLARRSLTAEQRAALEYAISSLEQCDSEPEDPVAVEILQSMLAQSRPAWEITEERQAAIELAQYGFRGFPQDAIDASIAELQEMLEEAI